MNKNTPDFLFLMQYLNKVKNKKWRNKQNKTKQQQYQQQQKGQHNSVIGAQPMTSIL